MTCPMGGGGRTYPLVRVVVSSSVVLTPLFRLCVGESEVSTGSREGVAHVTLVPEGDIHVSSQICVQFKE